MPTIEANYSSAEWALALDPKYRYIFIKGGRASGKSHEVAQYLVERSIEEKDLKVVCLREYQNSIEKSSKSLIEDKIASMSLGQFYQPVKSEIRKTLGKDKGLFFFQGMNDLTADNIKSLEGYKISWFEEAQNASFKTLKTLRPTIRVDGSQLIFTWNPKLPTDPIDEFCESMRGEPDVLVIHVNYTENPFLTDSMKREIELERKNSTPAEFKHIYLGDYDTSFRGHYYAELLQQAADQGRICDVPIKTGVDIITAWDLGLRDATAIWVAQRVGLQWRIIDYYENNFQGLDHYAQWIKDKGYNGKHFLPFDGAHERLGMQGSIKAQLEILGLNDVQILKNMTVDAGMSLARTLIKEAYFDKERCKEGLAALRHYHSTYDEIKKIYKALHDWSSHGSDAFRYLAQAIEESIDQPVYKPVDDTSGYVSAYL